MTLLTREDGLTALGEAHQASSLWDGYAAQPLWREALRRLTSTTVVIDLTDGLGSRYTETPADRWVLPLYDGDPPPVGSRPREECLYRRDQLTHELVWRVINRPAVRGSAVIRETHRAVHAALTGEDGTGYGAPGCPFCR